MPDIQNLERSCCGTAGNRIFFRSMKNALAAFSLFFFFPVFAEDPLKSVMDEHIVDAEPGKLTIISLPLHSF